jgi:hypothetical protein
MKLPHGLSELPKRHLNRRGASLFGGRVLDELAAQIQRFNPSNHLSARINETSEDTRPAHLALKMSTRYPQLFFASDCRASAHP